MSGIFKGLGRITLSIFAGILCGICRYTWQNSDFRQIQANCGENVVLSGFVATPPELKEKDLRLTIEAISFNYSTNTLKSQIYVMIPASTKLEIGRSDRIVFGGVLQEGFGNYAGFLYRPTVISVQKPRPPD